MKLKQYTMDEETKARADTLIGDLRKKVYGTRDKGFFPIKSTFENAVYGWVYENGTTDCIVGDACHYGLTQVDRQGRHGRSVASETVDGALAVVNLVKRPAHRSTAITAMGTGVHGALQFIYYDWLLNESPWAPVYITKDAKEAVEWGIIISTQAPANLVGGACVAIRHGWEKEQSYFLAQYFKRESNPVLRNIAYFFAGTLYNTNRGYNLFGFIPIDHWTIDPSRMSADIIKNFISGQPAAVKDSYYEYPGPFGCKGEPSLNNTWGSCDISLDEAKKWKDMYTERVKQAGVEKPVEVQSWMEDTYRRTGLYTRRNDSWYVWTVSLTEMYTIADEMFKEIAEEYNIKVA